MAFSDVMFASYSYCGLQEDLGALPLVPFRDLSRCALSVPFLLLFSVRSISLCAAYEPAVANLRVVCGPHSHSAGWTTVSAALGLGRSAS